VSEGGLAKEILLATSRLGARLFRCNTGQGWVGKVVGRTSSTITLRDPRPLHAGLVEGGSDLIGWTPVTITPEMVGQTIAVFTAVEIKTGRIPTTRAQGNFIERIREAGGKAGVVRTVPEAEHLVGAAPADRTASA
jgi:hypothetical protein